MLKYFPFGESFDPGMGGRVLPNEEGLLEVDEADYVTQVLKKRAQLEQFPSEYFHAGSETLAAQWEVVQLVLQDLATRWPSHFELDKSGAIWRWHNRLLGETHTFTWGENSSLPLMPLDWVGRQVQEDLLLVAADDVGTFVGGQLCFPNGWDIPERLGHSFLGMHTTTPSSTLPGVHAGGRLLASLLPGRIFCRIGWNLKLTAELDLSTKHAHLNRTGLAGASSLTPVSASQAIFVRIERQTFARLQSSPHTFFGIHTYLSPIAEEARDPERARRLLRVLESAPADVQRYKIIDAVRHALFPYLKQCAVAT